VVVGGEVGDVVAGGLVTGGLVGGGVVGAGAAGAVETGAGVAGAVGVMDGVAGAGLVVLVPDPPVADGAVVGEVAEGAAAEDGVAVTVTTNHLPSTP